jgi:hypothetical protein
LRPLQRETEPPVRRHCDARPGSTFLVPLLLAHDVDDIALLGEAMAPARDDA